MDTRMGVDYQDRWSVWQRGVWASRFKLLSCHTWPCQTWRQMQPANGAMLPSSHMIVHRANRQQQPLACRTVLAPWGDHTGWPQLESSGSPATRCTEPAWQSSTKSVGGFLPGTAWRPGWEGVGVLIVGGEEA